MPADEGAQTVSIKYHDPVDSYIVNERHRDVRPPGIYVGGMITIQSGAAGTISLSALVCEIRDTQYQVRIETTIAVNKTLTTVNNYLVLRWVYTGSESADYMLITATSSPATNDLIVGKGTFSGSTLISINYSERTWPNRHRYYLAVEPTDTPSSSVRVRSGSVISANAMPTFVATQLVDLSAYSAGQTVVVAVNDSGTVVSSRIDVTVASVAGRVILAEITIPAGGIITLSDITDRRAFLVQPTIPDDVLLEKDATGKLTIKNNSIDKSKIDNVFGSWAGKLSSVSYLAATDGVVLAYSLLKNQAHIIGYTDNSNPPTTIRTRNYIQLNNPCYANITMPVRKGDYWKVAGAGTVYWLPIGT
jgi:hypothetical protein